MTIMNDIANLRRRTTGGKAWLTPGQEKGLDNYKKADIFQLAEYRRAISNFVSIISGRRVPVIFQGEGGDSYTDNEIVVISSDITPYTFDSVCGLALHEGAHLLLSDFSLIKNLVELVAKEKSLVEKAEALGLSNEHKYNSKSEVVKISEITEHIKDLLNIFEDRRIDKYVYTHAPGYLVYYEAMYDRYFKSERIDKAIKNPKRFNKPTIDSYMFYLTNFVNKYIYLDTLPGLRDIYKLVDLNNIDRFKSTREIYELTLQVYEIILDNIDLDAQAKENEINKKAKDKAEAMAEKLKKMLEDMTPEELEEFIKDMQKQKTFSGGNVIKIDLPESVINKLKLLLESKSKIVELDSEGEFPDIECLVVHKVTDAMLPGDVFSTFTPYTENNWKHIQKGVLLGKMLGKKLKIRNESRTTIFTRKKSGSLNRRLLHEAGFGNNDIFNQTFVETFQDAILHISLDASYSMNGSKWDEAITSIVAICVAAEMSGNIDVTLSIRGCQDFSGDVLPTVIVIYDSRRDSIYRLKKVLSHVQCSSNTPEGLCFEASLNELYFRDTGRKMFFLNFSDGQPYFHNNEIAYQGKKAEEHTRKMVNKLKAMGMEIISYFIFKKSDISSRLTLEKSFKSMYGNDASFVDVTNMMEIARTINKKFLSK